MKIKSLITLAAVVLLNLSVSGCAAIYAAATQPGARPDGDNKTQVAAASNNGDSGKEEVTGINGAKGYVHGTAPKKNRFAKIKIGMSQKQVTDLIGQPSDSNSYATAKAFIPFYFGGDKLETKLYYKGAGRLVFASNNGVTTAMSLIGIEYDAGESGYAK